MDFATRERPSTSGRLSVEWEESQCLLCNSAYWQPLLEAADPLPGPQGLRFMIVQCQDCGLCYTNPRPSERSIASFYPKDYLCHRIQPIRGQLPRSRDPVQGLLPVRGQARLLDFGCGAGRLMIQMQACGWNVTGLDVSPDVVAQIRENFGIPAYAGSLPHPELADHSFEAITMWQSLEHVHRPLEVLRAARRLLIPEGRMLVAVPNIDSLPYRWFGPNWFALDVPRHLTHFSPTTLRAMLQQAGFKVDAIRMIRHPGWIRHSAELQAKRGQATLGTTRLLSTRWFSGLASWYSMMCRKADCILAVARRV